jgi:4'-phosphopantetheinyl transferase
MEGKGMVTGPESMPPRFLREGVLYLVRARPDDPGVPMEELTRVLSPEERNRAARFRFEADRLRSQVAWGLLRRFLGGLVGRDPASLEFGQSPYGKPFLAGGPSFNLAHSGDWILIGMASAGRVGVDVEWVRPDRDLESMAETVFRPDELAEFRAFPAAERPLAFYRGWARKEAFVKAVGRGLSLPLKEFSVSLAPGLGEALRGVDSPREREVPWRVRSLPDLPGAEGAFAWDRRVERVCWVDPVHLRP